VSTTPHPDCQQHPPTTSGGSILNLSLQIISASSKAIQVTALHKKTKIRFMQEKYNQGYSFTQENKNQIHARDIQGAEKLQEKENLGTAHGTLLLVNSSPEMDNLC